MSSFSRFSVVPCDCCYLGLIASVSEGGNDGDIALVQGMVSSYIQKPSCIILLVVACESGFSSKLQCYLYSPWDSRTADFENQGAHGLAKKFDKEGKRTIGAPRSFYRFRCTLLILFHRGFDEAGQNPEGRRVELVLVHPRRKGALEKWLVLCQTARLGSFEGKDYVVKSKGKRDQLFRLSTLDRARA